VGRLIAGLAAAGLLAALIAGVPYGLWHWLGWPLPHHWPTWNQTRDTLTGPFTDHILLDTLACLCWIVWAVFVTDVARAIPDTFRDARRNAHPTGSTTAITQVDRHSRPLRGLATLLLAAIITGLLSLRPHPALVAHPAASLHDARPRVVAAAVWTDRMSGQTLAAVGVPAGTRTAVVQTPHDGIHDSLWRIADRYLGDGARWPEIYELNQGLPQPDGGALTNPSMIRPGWILRLPGPVVAATPTPPQPTLPNTPTPNPPTPNVPTQPPSPVPSDPSSPPPPPSPSPSRTPQPGAVTSTIGSAAPAAPIRVDPGGHSGVDLGDGLYVSLGLAAAISGALVAVRRRNRRWYTPGSGRRDDLPVAPVVRSLHLAHLRATTSPPEDDDEAPEETGGDSEDPAGAPYRTGIGLIDGSAPEPVGVTPPGTVTSHIRNRRSASTRAAHTVSGTPFDLANSRGIGLVGAGAGDAARAILLDLLSIEMDDAGIAAVGTADAPLRPDVLIPAADLELLVGPHREGLSLPARAHVVADLATALDQLESAILHRVRRRESGGGEMAAGAIVLLARVPVDTARLQAVLDNGAPLGVTGVLLGQWRPGTSVYVGADGLVSAAHGPSAPMRGTRLFSLPPGATEILLGLLEDADRPRTASPATPILQSQGSATEHPTADAREDLSPPRATARSARVGERALTPTNVEQSPSLAEPNVTGTPRRATPGNNAPRTSHEERDVGAANSRARHVQAAAAGDAQGGHKTSPVSVAPLALRVLGPLSLHWAGGQEPAADETAHGEIIGALSPRVRELLVVLAVHPEGITRDRLADTLWPDSPPGRPFNNLNTNLGRLRTALSGATGGQVTEIVLTAGDQHRLDPALIDVDYRAFTDAAQARQLATSDAERIQAWQRMVATYRGELAEGLGTEWLETPREAIRRDAVDAATGLARLLVRDDPRQALDLLEAARSRDPYNEQLYGDIMRVQRRLGQADAIGRTLSLLAARLAELQETPSPETVALAEALQRAVSRRSEPDRSGDAAVR
jgi:DNA-binding SARP family transcriptional activator